MKNTFKNKLRSLPVIMRMMRIVIFVKLHKLKNVRYLGRFYEYEDSLGWMPWHQALITSFFKPEDFKWVKQSAVNFGKEQ